MRITEQSGVSLQESCALVLLQASVITIGSAAATQPANILLLSTTCTFALLSVVVCFGV